MLPEHSRVSTSLRQKVDIRRFPGMRRLAIDYVYAFDALAGFFAGNPTDRDDWVAAITRARSFPRRGRELAAIVTEQQQRRGAPRAAVTAAERLADPQAVAIVTGQQAGLFGGPVFTLLKAITTLKIAARVSREHRVTCVPIFWIDAEDHDWAEVASCHLLDGDLERRGVTLSPPPGAGERPVAAVVLDGSIGAAIDDLASILAPTEFSATLLTQLRSAYRTGLGMVEAFGRWLETVLGAYGLVVYDAADPASKRLVADVFAHELAHPGRSSTLVANAGRDLAARGYHAQVVPHEDHLALFHLDGGRLPIRFHGDLVSIGEAERPSREWVAEALVRPERFSPNVILRPIVEETLFPTVCYVAGPNELAYLAQLGGVYEHFGVPRPLVVPRATATLLDSAGAKFLERYHVPIESLQHDDEATLNHLLEAQLPAAVDRAFEEAARSVETGMGRLVEAVPAIDPTLEGAARSALGRMRHDLQTLHAKIIHAAKKRDETLRRQFRRARAQAFPDGHLQERAIGSVYFLNRYGPALVERLMADLPLDMGVHWVMTV